MCAEKRDGGWNICSGIEKQTREKDDDLAAEDSRAEMFPISLITHTFQTAFVEVSVGRHFGHTEIAEASERRYNSEKLSMLNCC